MQLDPGKPTGEARLLNLAMKAILVVAIASIVSMIIIVGYSPPRDSILADGPYAEPNVALAQADVVGASLFEVEVAGVSEARDLENFKAVLLKNRTVWDEMDPLTERTTTYISFTDLDGGGTVSVGDYFIVNCDPGSSYKLNIVWRDSGNVRGSEEWET